MRTYDDSFSGQKIYPGKVRCAVPLHRHVRRQMSKFRDRATTMHIPGRHDGVVYYWENRC